MKLKRDKVIMKSIPEQFRNIHVGDQLMYGGCTCTFFGIAYYTFQPIILITGPGGIATRTVQWELLQPVYQWEPQHMELVAAWCAEWNPVQEVEIRRYTPNIKPWNKKKGENLRYAFFGHIPEGMVFTKDNITINWWMVNGELHEVDNG